LEQHLNDSVQIELMPLGEVLRVERGTALQEVLFAHGVEFPCGGHGRCHGCRIKVLEGSLPVSAEELQELSTTEIAGGWRLACRARAVTNLKLELAQWQANILADHSKFEFTPRDGWGVAVDIGTTTLAAQLLDLRTGDVLAVRTALNAQAEYGADVMSRVEFAVADRGQSILEHRIRQQVGGMIQELLAAARVGQASRRSHGTEPGDDKGVEEPLKLIVLVGNAVMHHLFCGLSLEPLSHAPFEPISTGLQEFSAGNLGWALPGAPQVQFLPCLGGFVGSDILAGVLATGLNESNSLEILIDLGTNGEIALGNRDCILCASTAAGPAFEGARISMGMRAATGAISAVHAQGGQLRCEVIGHVAPRGICGSGLVDAVAAGLELRKVLPNGRLAEGDSLLLAPPVTLSAWDLRELQLAKGAIAAGVQVLLQRWGASKCDVRRVHLAGAFGNYINLGSARRIGLLDFPPEVMHPAGNTALFGAKLALFAPPNQPSVLPQVLAKTQHVALNEDPRFHDNFVEEMRFPEH
jgi:uncharacterized 2Fe-2S/4Fe-4S cluster protein (DUF4445 family)